MKSKKVPSLREDVSSFASYVREVNEISTFTGLHIMSDIHLSDIHMSTFT